MRGSSSFVAPFEEAVSERVWEQRYRLTDGNGGGDVDLEGTLGRVAHALAAPEGPRASDWAARFLDLMQGFRFLPGGRVLAGAGTGRRVTLFNCFVMGVIEDSMEGIFRGLEEGAVTMQQGGGVGYDFSTLRPAGMHARSTGRIASGPVSFMRLWNDMCATLTSTWPRRGAMMGTLRCDHPDIRSFIHAKSDPGDLNCFNLSVQVTDDFMKAVEADEDWPLVFPDPEGHGDTHVLRTWAGFPGLVPCRVVRTVKAAEVWRDLVAAATDNGEPGVLFVDRINACNNLWYRELISATNPCGEVPLPPYGACDLGSLNLTAFVQHPFTPHARLDTAALEQSAAVAVRLLDNVIDVSVYPLPAQAEQVLDCRRLGLGMMGLADALVMLGLAYDSAAARRLAADAARTICHAAYRASIGLAAEKAGFPQLDRKRYLKSRFVQELPAAIRRDIGVHGIRNSHLMAIAPTGSISLLANNVSSGIEPIFGAQVVRRLTRADGGADELEVTDFAVRRWRRINDPDTLPPAFVSAQELAGEAHLAMQSAIQPHVDQAIAKTVNVGSRTGAEAIGGLFFEAWREGLKGMTVFRQSGREPVLRVEESSPSCRREVCAD